LYLMNIVDNEADDDDHDHDSHYEMMNDDDSG
jgi:hypothetical protein